MTTEPATLPPDVFEAVIRAARETARAEIRADIAARAMAKRMYDEHVAAATAENAAMEKRAAEYWASGDSPYEFKVPTTMHGQSI